MNKLVCLPRLDRWLGLSTAMIMMGCAGLTYTYAVYSEHMKHQLHFTQEQVDDIGAAKDFGGVLGLFSGVFYNMYPPWVTVGIGAFLHLFGYTMVWMTIAGKVAPSFWLLCMYFVAGHGGDNWIDTACMMTSLQNYEEHRGTAMGILKAQLGLSGAIFVMAYEVLLEPDVNRFLLVMSLVPTFIYFSLACFIRPFNLKDDNGSPALRFKMIFITVVVLGVYMMFSMACKEYFSLSKTVQHAIITLMFVVMATMYIIPLLHIHENHMHGREEIEMAKLLKKSSNIQEHTDEESLANTDTSENNILTSHIGIKDSLLDFNLWLIFLIVTIGAGTGISIINNFAQIGEALRARGTDDYVGLISVWSCFGRLGSGYGSDYMMRHGYPRTVCLLIIQISMGLCCLLLATGLRPSLYIGSALTGLTYGSYWTLVPAVLSEVFGVQNFTFLYKLVSLGPPVGSYLLSAKVMGYLYDEEALSNQGRSSNDDDDDTCYGPKCFGFGLLALSFVSFIGAFASFLLFLGTKPVYHKTKLTT